MSAERDSIVDPKQRLRCGPGDVGLFASHFILNQAGVTKVSSLHLQSALHVNSDLVYNMYVYFLI